MLGLGNSTTGGASLEGFVDLTSVSSLQLWLKNGVGLANDPVSQWDDSSGNSRNVRQTTEGDRADLSGGGLLFKETESDHYDLATPIEIAKNQGFCMAYVLKTESGSNNTLLSNSGNEVIQVQNSSKIRINCDDDSNISTQLHSGSAFGNAKMQILINRTGAGVWTVYKNASELTIAADGVGASSNSDPGDNVNGLSLSILGTKGTASGHFMDGTLFELAFWDRALTAGEMVEVSTYLKDKHSL